MSKIEKFVRRNRKRNAHLYLSGLQEGYDFVVCPVSKERLSMIKNNYIVKILGMKIENYPNVQRICNKRKENIKTGLKEIDPSSGLTKYEVGQIKARKVLSQCDSNGVRGYDRKGQKTRATHMSKIDEFGRNGYKRQAYFRKTTVLQNGLTVEQNAHLKQKETLIKKIKTGSGGASAQSKKVLKPIVNFLQEHKIKFYFDSREYGIKDTKTGNYYFYDLTIPNLRIAIEYQSSAWHADPTLPEEDWNKWIPPRGKKYTAQEVLDYDYKKAKSLFEHRGLVTYYVWQRSQEQDVEEILCLLKTLITKY